MNERRFFLFLTLLPVALAIFFWDLDTRLSAPAENIHTQQRIDEQQLPTTILEKTRLTQYDISGTQSQKVTSERLLSNDFQQIIKIERPIITLETDDGHWLAESDTGEFNRAENKLALFGSVTLTQTPITAKDPHSNEEPYKEPQNLGSIASVKQNPVQMQTEQLDYYPEIRFVETDTQVRITSPGHRIESEGVQVDLVNSIYRLPKKVRSTHEPM